MDKDLSGYAKQVYVSAVLICMHRATALCNILSALALCGHTHTQALDLSIVLYHLFTHSPTHG